MSQDTLQHDDGNSPAVAADLATVQAPVRQPADLVLEGGGVKGIGLVGAVLELDAAGYTFKRVAGTSAGAIVAALIAALNAAGKPLSALNGILESVDYSKFTPAGPLRRALPFGANAMELLLHMGMYDGNYLVEWLGGELEKIGVTRFRDLKLDDPGADPSLKYSLVVVTSDITRSKCVQLPSEYPEYGIPDIDDQLIVNAVRASMSIPFFFEPVHIDAPAAIGPGYHFGPETVTWVDGGMLSNFPLDVFDRHDGVAARWPTIGVKLSAREPAMAPGARVGSVIGEAVACLHTMMDNADRYYVDPTGSQIVFVDSCGVKTTDFAITPADQELLANSGHLAARTWLDALPVAVGRAHTSSIGQRIAAAAANPQTVVTSAAAPVTPASAPWGAS